MHFIQHQAGHVQAMLCTDFRRQDLVKPSVAVIDDTLGRAHNLGAFQQRRGHVHHLLCHIEHDGRLLAVGGSAIHLGGWLIIRVEKIESDGRCEFAFAVLLPDLHEGCAELALPTLVNDAEHIPDNLFLPWEKPEPLSCPFTLGVAQALDELDGAIRFGFVVMG